MDSANFPKKLADSGDGFAQMLGPTMVHPLRGAKDRISTRIYIGMRYDFSIAGAAISDHQKKLQKCTIMKRFRCRR